MAADLITYRLLHKLVWGTTAMEKACHGPVRGGDKVNRSAAIEGEAFDERNNGAVFRNRRAPQLADWRRNPRGLFPRRSVDDGAAEARVRRQTRMRRRGFAAAESRLGTWRAGDGPRVRDRLVGRGDSAGRRAGDLLRADERGPGGRYDQPGSRRATRCDPDRAGRRDRLCRAELHGSTGRAVLQRRWQRRNQRRRDARGQVRDSPP